MKGVCAPQGLTHSQKHLSQDMKANPKPWLRQNRASGSLSAYIQMLPCPHPSHLFLICLYV